MCSPSLGSFGFKVIGLTSTTLTTDAASSDSITKLCPWCTSGEAGLLVAAGVTLVALPLANMNFMISGPLVGVVVGFVILTLGVTKGIGTAKMQAGSQDT